ncbi:START domain-containing protein [Arsukibacterium sp.]|uniref:START domain-containing protein n=1 Tax=Arsukibacterium sp. TaxID=1977258 RepID=UPI00356619A6
MIFHSGVALAQTNDWQLYKTAGDVLVEYRRDSDNLLEIRAKTRVSSKVEAFKRLLEDTGNIDKWAANADKAELISHPDADINIVHTYFSAMWPVSDRDMVTKSVWTQHKESGELTLNIQDVGAEYPTAKGYIRMQQVQAKWTLTPQPDGSLLINYQGQADPAGNLPHFLADKVALKSIFTTFERLPAVLQQYQ